MRKIGLLIISVVTMVACTNTTLTGPTPPSNLVAAPNPTCSNLVSCSKCPTPNQDWAACYNGGLWEWDTTFGAYVGNNGLSPSSWSVSNSFGACTGANNTYYCVTDPSSTSRTPTTQCNLQEPPCPTQSEVAISTATCNLLNQCDPFGLQLSYGDLATCINRNEILYISLAGLTGSGLSQTNIQTCATALTTASCTDFFASAPVTGCGQAGTLGIGAACQDKSQCASSYCAITSSSCGTCQTAPTPVTRGLAGAACSSSTPCNAVFACINSVCSTPLGASAACTETPDNCNHLQGYYCISNTCQKQTATAPISDGGACIPNLSVCTAPATCVNNVCTLPYQAQCS